LILVKNLITLQFMYYNTKSVSIKLEDVDVSKGIIKVIPSIFGNIDSDNEMIPRGAFN